MLRQVQAAPEIALQCLQLELERLQIDDLVVVSILCIVDCRLLSLQCEEFLLAHHSRDPSFVPTFGRGIDCLAEAR